MAIAVFDLFSFKFLTNIPISITAFINSQGRGIICYLLMRRFSPKNLGFGPLGQLRIVGYYMSQL